MNPSRFLTIGLALIVLTGSGCSTVNRFQQNQQTKRTEHEKKKTAYLTLQKDIATNKLSTGVLMQDLKEKYGHPDDIFYSSSNISSFQIWTYEKVVEKSDDKKWDPIRLYFEDNKLISWKY